MAKNRRRNSKKKARYRRQRSPERLPLEPPPIEDPRSGRIRRILAGVGVQCDGLHHLDIERMVLGLSWDGLTDHLVMKHAPKAMTRAVEDYFDFSGLDLQATPSKVGVMLHRGRVAHAVVYPTRALLLGGSIRGDFTADGSHWSTLRTALLERRLPQREHVAADSSMETKERADVRRVVVAFPSHVEESFRARVLAASTRIRTERSLDYGSHPVVLEASDHVVRYEAITRRGGAVELPFSFAQKGQTAIRGALRLRSPGDPLALVCSPDLGEDMLALVWGSGLIGFAELTCVAEIDRPNDSVTRRGERQRPQGGVSERDRYLASGGGGHSNHPSPTLHPTARTADALASYVAGHRRRLSDAAHPSDEARAAADDIGIVLGPHETWVRPHVRGVPTDAELHFRWMSPVSLAA